MTEQTIECGPVAATWFGIGLWPTCACGLDPRDNAILKQHWADAGFEVVDNHGRLVVTPIKPDTMPTSEHCPIGPLNAHTYNYQRDECIWCGPNRLAWQSGRWVDTGDGYNAWSVEAIEEARGG